MGLIICPDCGKEVSDQAPACIHCGRPLQAVNQPLTANDLRAIAQEDAEREEAWRKLNNKRRLKAIGFGAIAGPLYRTVFSLFDLSFEAMAMTALVAAITLAVWFLAGLIGGLDKIHYFLGKFFLFCIGSLLGMAALTFINIVIIDITGFDFLDIIWHY